jgi:hypothetical protein
MFLQTTLAAEDHLAGGNFLLKKQPLNMENSLMHRTGTPRQTVSRRRQNSEPR